MWYIFYLLTYIFISNTTHAMEVGFDINNLSDSITTHLRRGDTVPKPCVDDLLNFIDTDKEKLKKYNIPQYEKSIKILKEITEVTDKNVGRDNKVSINLFLENIKDYTKYQEDILSMAIYIIAKKY